MTRSPLSFITCGKEMICFEVCINKGSLKSVTMIKLTNRSSDGDFLFTLQISTLLPTGLGNGIHNKLSRFSRKLLTIRILLMFCRIKRTLCTFFPNAGLPLALFLPLIFYCANDKD